jgi:penicillin-binding protein 1A
MNAILQKAIQRGTGVAIPKTYGVSQDLAGKTGTSQNFSDAWFVSYNPELVMVTRVGASSPQIHFNSGAYGSGSRLALPLAGLTWQAAQQDSKLKPEVFKPFPELSLEWQQQMTCDDFKESSKLEEFLKKDKTSTKEKTKKGKKEREKKKKKKGFFQRIFKKD